MHYKVSTYRFGDSIGYMLRRSSALLRSQLESQFEGQPITAFQWLTLMSLREDPSRSPADLCRTLNHDSGAFTRVLDQLEARGLVARERSVEDRRSVRLLLTPAGHAAIAAELPSVVGNLNIALTDFSAEEVALLTRLLHKLVKRLEARRQESPTS